MTIDKLNGLHDNHETGGPESVDQSQLDTIELSVREQQDEGKSDEDIRASISSALEELGLSPLAENETQRTFSLTVDGETVERTIVVDPGDFGTAIRPISEMGIDGFTETESSNETSMERFDRILGETALSELINEGVETNPENSMVDASEVVATEPSENETVTDNDPEHAEEEINNDEQMAAARKTVDELVSHADAANRSTTAATQEIVDTLSRPMINLESLENATRMLQRKVSELVEEASTASRMLASTGEQLDSRSADSVREHRDIDDAFTVIRRAASSLEGELSAEIRIVSRLAQDAQYDTSARQMLVARGRNLADVTHEAMKRHARVLQEIEL